MQPTTAIEALRWERPDLSNDQLRTREHRIRAFAEAGLLDTEDCISCSPDDSRTFGQMKPRCYLA